MSRWAPLIGHTKAGRRMDRCRLQGAVARRIIDMRHMSCVDESLFGKQIESRLPAIVTSWVEKKRTRQQQAPVVHPDQTPLL